MRTLSSRHALALLAAVVTLGAAAGSGAEVWSEEKESNRQATEPFAGSWHDHRHAQRPSLRAREALAVARATSAAYHRVEEAELDGYALPPAPAPLHECITAENGPGAMGFHHINSDHVSDTVLDPARPESLVYEPTRNGRLRLVALEYVVFADAWDKAHRRAPRLLGRRLTLVPDGNRYELPAFYQIHAWVWKRNPHGRHADHNPRVSCRYAGRVE
jgi:hypothetical protein